MTKGIIKWTLIILVVTGSLVGSYNLAKDWKFNSDAPEADFPAPDNLAEARLQDVEHLALFMDYERSWAEDSLEAARLEHKSLAEQASTMNDAEFELAVARFVALAGNAHSKVREYNRTPKYSRLPIRGYWFSDGYHVIRAYQGFEALIGHKLVAIDGVSMDDVFAQLKQYIAGPEGTLKKYTPYLLESPELMNAAGITRSPLRMEVSFENTTNAFESEIKTTVFEAPFPSSSDQIARTHYLLTPQVYSESQPDWKMSAEIGESTPTYLDLPAERMQAMEMPEIEASYVQFWTNSDVGSTSIGDFCGDALRAYQQKPSRNIVIDQRFNGGGNFNLTQSCMEGYGESIPDDGYLYVIIGGSTFSAGMYSSAFLKNSGGERVVLVGESVGDTMVHWGEDNLLRLPNSGIEIKFSTGKHNLGGKCADWKECQWDALFLNLNIDDLEPDIYAPLSYQDFAAQIDPALEAIKKHQNGGQ